MEKAMLEVNKDKLESRMSRVFDAPREAVWNAHVSPEAVEQWWGPRGYTTKVEVLEPRVGGKWRYIHEYKGEKYVFYGEFRELIEPEKIVCTFTFEGYPDSVLVETLTLEEVEGGKTKLTTVSVYPSLESLNGMIGSGMEKGANESWDKLQEFLSK